MEVFLYYVYKDELDSRLDAELAAAVLHIAQYYGAPRLAGLCERLLAREIKNGDADDEGAFSSGFRIYNTMKLPVARPALHCHMPLMCASKRQVAPCV